MVLSRAIASSLIIAIALVPSRAGSACDAGRPRFVDRYSNDIEFDIVGFGGSREGRVCREFSMDRQDVEFFFKHAELIDGYTLEKEYPWYGCWFEGVLHIKDSTFRWEITPGGKGALTPDNGDDASIIYLVCDEGCEELFPEGGNMFEEYH